MTEQQASPGPDPTEAYATEYRRLWDATVATLTAAVQLDHPQHGAVDFSDFLASALGAVAANVGSAERITAGRPGSWESDALGQLVTGTVGYDADAVELAPLRTVPVLVPLNVAQLVTEAYQDAPHERRETMLPHVDDAAQVLYRAGEEWRAAHPAPAEDAPEAEWETYSAAEDAQAEQEQADEDALRARYAATFQAYAEAFTAAVLDEARTIEGLSVPVEVQAQTDPKATWWDPTDTINPDDYGSDALAWHLWAAARDRVPLPRALVDIPAEAAEEEQ
jgi:hypothetical protein